MEAIRNAKTTTTTATPSNITCWRYGIYSFVASPITHRCAAPHVLSTTNTTTTHFGCTPCLLANVISSSATLSLPSHDDDVTFSSAWWTSSTSSFSICSICTLLNDLLLLQQLLLFYYSMLIVSLSFFSSSLSYYDFDSFTQAYIPLQMFSLCIGSFSSLWSRPPSSNDDDEQKIANSSPFMRH